MTLGDVAGLIAAIAFVALVGFVALPLIKLGKVLDELRSAVRELGQESVPILTELQDTVKATNDELSKLAVVTEHVSVVTKDAGTVSTSAAQMSTLLTTAVAVPVVKTVAFTQGVRKALRRPRRSDPSPRQVALIDEHPHLGARREDRS